MRWFLRSIEAGLRGDVGKFSATQIPEQIIAHANRRHEKIGLSVVVNVSERGRDGNLVGKTNARLCSNVFEFAAPDVSPELAFAKLIHEINIQPAIAIHIS